MYWSDFRRHAVNGLAEPVLSSDGYRGYFLQLKVDGLVIATLRDSRGHPRCFQSMGQAQDLLRRAGIGRVDLEHRLAQDELGIDALDPRGFTRIPMAVEA